MINWKIEKRKVSDLKEYGLNPRKISEEGYTRLKNKIQTQGFHDIFKINTDNTILSGNQRKRVLNELGFDEVDVRVPERFLNDEEAKAVVISSNRQDGMWDWDVLGNSYSPELLMDLGFEKYELDFYPNQEDKDDDIPELKIKTDIKIGDIYKLGRNRLICGDSKDLSYYENLMDGKFAKLVFTSPPYNIGGGMYQNYKDDMRSDEYINFNLQVVKNCNQFLKGFLFWNISYNKKSRWEFLEIMNRIVKETGLKFLELIVWDKGHGMPITSKEMVTRRYEDILLAGNEAEIAKDLELFGISRNFAGAYFNKKNNRGISNYWKVDTNKTQLENHKACYPVELPVKGIMLMTDKDEIVLDPFIGSGTTFISCEKTGRICYGIEVDPIYCQQTIDRWEKYTGNKAQKVL